MKIFILFFLVILSSCSQDNSTKSENQSSLITEEVLFESLNVKTFLDAEENRIPISSLDFAILQAKQNGVQDLIITNGLLTNLVFGINDIDASNISPFVMTDSCSNKTIARNRSCKLTFSILNNPSSTESVLTKSLTIKGTVIQLTATLAADTVSVNTPIGGIIVSPSILDFGLMKNTETKDLSLIITNKGTNTQNITAPIISNAKLSITSNTCSSLIRNRSCTIKVRYSASDDESILQQSFTSIANNDIKYNALVESPTINEPQVLTINPLITSSLAPLNEPEVYSTTTTFTNLGTVELPSPVQAIADPSIGININSVSCSGGLSRGRTCAVSYSINSALVASGISQVQLKLQSGTLASNIHTINLDVVKLSSPCLMSDAQTNGWNTSNAQSVSGSKVGLNLTQCIVSSCNNNFSLNSITKTCDDMTCSNLNAIGNGIDSLLNVDTVGGYVPNCLISTCSSNYKISTDAKSCVVKNCNELNGAELSVLGFNLENAVISGVFPNCSLSCNSSLQELSADSKSCVDKTPSGSIYFQEDYTKNLNDNLLNINHLNSQKIQFYSDAQCGTPIGGELSLPLSNTLINLSIGDGIKNVYAKLINGLISSNCLTDSIILDQTAPVISITIPIENSTISQNLLIVNGTCIESNPENIQLSISMGEINQNVSCSSGTFASSFDISGLVEGIYSIVITSSDLASNEYITTKTFNKILELACIATDAQSNGWILNNSITYSGMKFGTDVSQCNISHCENGYGVSIATKSCILDFISTSITITGKGLVSGTADLSSEFSCLGPITNCDNQVASSQTLSLQAIPNSGQFLSSWGEDCFGETSSLCSLFTSSNKIVSINFAEKFNKAYDKQFLSTPSVVAIQVDGKIVIGGNFTSYNGTLINRIARLNTDGTLDSTFNVGNGANGQVSVIKIQSDGKIIIAGSFTSYNGINRSRIARLNTNGSIDTTFLPGSGASSTITKMALQSDGKIIIGGAFTAYYGSSANKIARVNADGSLDTNFSVGTGPNGSVISVIAIQNDKILVSGNFTTFNSVSKSAFLRLNSDGSIDSSFNLGGAGATSGPSTIAFDSNQKIIIGGSFTSYNGTAINRIARLNSDGTIDPTFSTVTGLNTNCNSIMTQADGKIVVGGPFSMFDGNLTRGLVRLNSNGTIDLSFNSIPGINAGGVVSSLELQNDGKVVIIGSFTSYNTVSRNGIAKINSDGSLDTPFSTSNGFNATVNSIAVQSDGKILVGGQFISFNGTLINRLARINSDGNIDTSFNIGSGYDNAVLSIVVRSNEKILIGGSFFNKLVQLNSDGTVDSNFNSTGAGANGTVRKIVLQSDGKILIGGDFTTYNGTARNRIARLYEDGTLDITFNPGTGVSALSALAVQTDGKILIGGNFTSYNVTSINRVARINSDGTIDSTFNVGTGANGDVTALKIQSDGKILIGGSFTSYNGTVGNRIARINTDGSYDSTFNIGTGFGSYPLDFLIQSDGKIIIGGNFITYNSTSKPYLVRLNTDGAYDTSFLIGTGASGDVNALVLNSDGKIFIGGAFFTYNGQPADRFLKLNINGTESND